jgi:hypothetical protein
MKNYSKVQKDYLAAKKNLEVIKEQSENWTKKWLKQNALSDLTSAYEIENDDIFETWSKGNAEFEETLGISKVKEMLNITEENLINWSLNKVKKDLPKVTYQTLLKGMKQYKIRCELIELALKL